MVQLNPQIGHIEDTLVRARALINRIERYSPDLVVFPEFALTGYNFHSRAEISPYLCHPKEGPAWEFCQQLSKRLSCVTVMGYPERSDGQRAYNSAIVVDEKGQLAFNYRKSFMYYTEDEWQCSENPEGFQTFAMPLKNKARDSHGRLHDISLRSAIGICMDLSPYQFKAPFHDYEFSSFQAERGTELIICPMAWLHSCSVTGDTEFKEQQRKKITDSMTRLGFPPQGSQGEFQIDVKLDDGTDNRTQPDSVTCSSDLGDSARSYSNPTEPDKSNIDFWILRFMPFLAFKGRNNWFTQKLIAPVLARFKGKRSSYMGSSTDKPWIFENKNAVLVLCNRSGVEDGTTVFAGSSGIFKFNGKGSNENDVLDSTNTSVDLLGNLGKSYEGVLVRDVEFEIEREL